MLENQERGGEMKYLERCWEIRRHLMALVYLVDGMSGKDAKAAGKRLVCILTKKSKREYLDMIGFVRSRMMMAVVISNNMLLKEQ